MRYFKEVLKTFVKNYQNIFATGLFIWTIFPVIFLAISGIALLFNIISLDIFIKFFRNAIIGWWISIILNCKKFLFEYMISIFITIILVHHKIIKPLNFQEVFDILFKRIKLKKI